jgi:hypothetical protein
MALQAQGGNTQTRRTGCDIEATRYIPLTGRTEHVYFESKNGPDAPMTDAQRKMKKDKKGHYRVLR